MVADALKARRTKHQQDPTSKELQQGSFASAQWELIPFSVHVAERFGIGIEAMWRLLGLHHHESVMPTPALWDYPLRLLAANVLW